ncbi:hypothetical protein PILCRDRAFT_333 [Piloderma croceum F 1598]|uniref:Uncharacterized protein n=1 Tax=Piloderma croceum (strain F 1598) TaxID=765440 RepID=A0A0C3GL07_PILCF|nr:hypothetical protein PILCRDRAFT_333 [Piloderma croceum F 1598]
MDWKVMGTNCILRSPAMGKSRKSVPAALHSELSEYALLLRALRTSDTLDLTSQLTKALPQPSTFYERVNGADGDDGEEGIRPTVSASREDTPSAPSASKLKGSSRRSSSRKSKDKDNWTRWPLLEGYVHAPEFGFQDEIEMIASEALKLQQSQEDPDGDDHLPEEDYIESRLPQSLLDSLTLASSTHLSQILAALAAHVPLAEKSMQNRIKPIGWEGVLDIVAVSGLVDPKIVEVVQHRMERLYGLSERHSVSRAQSSLSTKRTLDDFISLHDMSFLAVPEPSVHASSLKRKKRKKRKEEIDNEPGDEHQQDP